MYNANLNRILQKARKQIWLETGRDDIFEEKLSCHILRHTSATRMAEAGMTPATLQYILGYSDPRRTMQIYVHAKKEQVKKALEALNILAL